MQNKPLILALLVGGMALSGAAQAALIDRGGGLIYDTDLNITWLADANYAKTSGYDADGLMNWTTANAWAAGLSYGGYSDWRLPTSDTCVNFNCTGSEMGHLFYTELGGTAGSSILSSADADLALFTNIQPLYWSGTEYAPAPALAAWGFRTDYGSQGEGDKLLELSALAVRPGDVGGTVPEPFTLALFGVGLAGMGWARRQR